MFIPGMNTIASDQCKWISGEVEKRKVVSSFDQTKNSNIDVMLMLM